MWLRLRTFGCGPITARLRAATWEFVNLPEDDFPGDVRQRAMRLREKLTVQYRLLEDKGSSKNQRARFLRIGRWRINRGVPDRYD
jgi:hypothetical protein